MLSSCVRLSIWQALLISLVMSAITVLADTEIRNFEVPLPTPIRSIYPSTPVLDLPYSTSPHILNVSHQKPEVWIRTPIQGNYKKWTARVSWPGSTPTKFGMEVLPCPHYTLRDQSSDHVIIHLSASLLSPRFPRQPSSGRPKTPSTEDFYTTFALVVEPLIFGILPQTAVPAVIWALILGLGAACVVPYIIRYLDTINIAGLPDHTEGKGVQRGKLA